MEDSNSGKYSFGRFDKFMGIKDKTQIKEMSVRDMVGIMRKLNEDIDNANKSLSQSEIDREEEKMQNYFQNNNVNIQFEPLIVYSNGVFWGGTIDGQLLFTYSVTPDEATSKVDIKYLNGFDPADPDNDEIIKKVQAYYNDFYKYWRDNGLQLDDDNTQTY